MIKTTGPNIKDPQEFHPGDYDVGFIGEGFEVPLEQILEMPTGQRALLRTENKEGYSGRQRMELYFQEVKRNLRDKKTDYLIRIDDSTDKLRLLIVRKGGE